MTVLIKFIFVFLLLYLGIRMITKPFRDFLRYNQKQTEMNSKKSSTSKHQGNKTKTDDLGEYIDYEEVNE